MKPNVLIVDDDRELTDLLVDALARRGYSAETASHGEAALAAVRAREFDVVVTDVVMEGMSGLELCERFLEAQPEVPVVVLTALANVDTAVAAIRAGAYDFITKPIRVEPFLIALDRAIQQRQLKREIRRLRQATVPGGVEGIIGESPAIRRIFELVQQVAPTDATMLVTGESGTGKELVARAIHQASSRAGAPFLAINCAAMPPSLLESELFGHVRGAFTDAKRSRPGLFVQAGQGTLFLDEIAEMPLEMQAKLLRVLQERTVRPVGADTEVPFDARLVAATNRALEREVQQGRFREDLFYRINVIEIEVPPLRDRRSDVLMLAQHFLRGHAARMAKAVDGISRPAAQKLLEYEWPGNVRELENSMERAVAMARHSEITADDLPDRVRAHQSTRIPQGDAAGEPLLTLEELERRHIRLVLQAAGGNKARAARILGIDRRSLYRRLDEMAAAASSAPNGEGRDVQCQ
jgi:two-component system response regulator HydG